MILGMGPLELVIVVAIVLVIFGPKNLPKLGSALGKTVKSVREGLDDPSDDTNKKDEKAKSSAKSQEAEDVVVEDSKEH